MAVIELRIMVYYGPSIFAAIWRLVWAYRGIMAMLAATAVAVWYLLPSRYGKYYIAKAVIWIVTTRNMNDFNIRDVLIPGHDKFVATFNHWEKEKAMKMPMPALLPYDYFPLDSPRHIRLLRLKKRSLFQPPS
ncbi:hypothetical protein T440DRAFT_163447 [Plenodomus tracheiphilus IPT5]|uniref:Uncharacterized protein n=1 Tax=Plenodomus tracheiphilus IPT5 TaxID=1408161 RepID=A0A6A7BMQ6_9PLEO|nr:hypothetical protein T440DRAFT_163447 [Plenodomus tracheiphilus IPT5]